MPRNVRVVPAILTESPASLEKMVRQSETFTDYVQFDIMDSQFVPSRSVNPDVLRHLPMKLKWEAHLMTEDPATHFANLRLAGAQRVIFHYEAVKSPEQIIAQARQSGLEVGVAINPETPAAAVRPLADKVDSFLVLSVRPGYYGSKFLPEVLDKVGELLPSGVEIGIDGGIKESNIAEVARTGLHTIYVGSAIFLQADPATCYRHLQELAQNG